MIFFYYYSHAVPSTFSLFGTMSHERCKLLSAFFFENEETNKQEKNLSPVVLLPVRVVALTCVHCDRVSCMEHKGLLNVYY